MSRRRTGDRAQPSRTEVIRELQAALQEERQRVADTLRRIQRLAENNSKLVWFNRCLMEDLKAIALERDLVLAWTRRGVARRLVDVWKGRSLPKVPGALSSDAIGIKYEVVESASGIPVSAVEDESESGNSQGC